MLKLLPFIFIVFTLNPTGARCAGPDPKVNASSPPQSESKACLKEGERGEVKGMPALPNRPCCPGLKESKTIEGCDGACKHACGARLDGEVSHFVCLSCGDKKCDPRYESVCNCPEDCKLPEDASADGPKTQEECYLKPCYLNGDFDGDGKQDRAVLVRSADFKYGIKITIATKRSFVLGAGECFGNGGCNFDWMNRWTLHRKQKIKQGATELKPPPRAKGDFLLLEKMDSASGIAYWDGKKFTWYQQGD